MWHVTRDTWHVTHDTWHVTRDPWHVTRDTFGGVNILSKCQLPSSYCLWFMILWRYFRKRMNHLINEWITKLFVGQPRLHRVSQLLLDFKILFNCFIITLIDLQRDGVTKKCFRYMATYLFFWYWLWNMLNISIFGGGGEMEVIFWKLEFNMHTYLLFFCQK